MRRYLWTVLGLGLCAALPAMPAAAQMLVPFMAVDADGTQVAVVNRASVWDTPTVSVYRMHRGDWKEVASIEAERHAEIRFVGKMLMIGEQLHALVDDRLAPVGAPLEVPLSLIGGMRETAVHGDRMVITGMDFPRSPALIWEATAEGWRKAEEIPADKDFPFIFGWRRIAYDGDRLALLLLPHADRCAVLVFDRGESGWARSAQFFPEVCADPEVSDGALALHGDRMLIGAFPMVKGPGELAIHALRADGWQQVARLARPDQEGDYVNDEVLPYAFGHRVALDGEFIYAGGGYQTILEDSPGSIRASTILNGVFFISPEGDGWQTRKHVAHADVNALFGEAFELRGKRLFIDSRMEPAIYVYKRGSGGWKQVARIAAKQE